MRKLSELMIAAALMIGCVATTSCSRYAAEPDSGDGPVHSGDEVGAGDSPTEHGHQTGASGGVIASLGRDEYHTEAVLESGGVLTLYTLGQDETRVHEVPPQVLTAYLRPQGSSEALVMILNPDPLPSDSPSMTSRFSGQLPERLAGRPFHATLPGLRINGERFTVRFESPADSPEPVMPTPAMPAPREDLEAEELYLTAGGLYSEADIAANGGVTAAEKYVGFRAVHDLHPQAGELICPITRTKANPQCSWIVGGKTYQFCCPPCIDEFVQRAKQQPEEILEPQEYVQRE